MNEFNCKRINFCIALLMVIQFFSQFSCLAANPEMIISGSFGSTINKFSLHKMQNGEYAGPSRFVIGENSIYILDNGNNRVVQYSFKGSLIGNYMISPGPSSSFIATPEVIYNKTERLRLFISDDYLSYGLIDTKGIITWKDNLLFGRGNTKRFMMNNLGWLFFEQQANLDDSPYLLVFDDQFKYKGILNIYDCCIQYESGDMFGIIKDEFVNNKNDTHRDITLRRYYYDNMYSKSSEIKVSVEADIDNIVEFVGVDSECYLYFLIDAKEQNHKPTNNCRIVKINKNGEKCEQYKLNEIWKDDMIYYGDLAQYIYIDLNGNLFLSACDKKGYSIMKYPSVQE